MKEERGSWFARFVPMVSRASLFVNPAATRFALDDGANQRRADILLLRRPGDQRIQSLRRQRLAIRVSRFHDVRSGGRRIHPRHGEEGVSAFR